jgi:glycosyltransferase involved in cell wall biosynthesis
MMEKPEKRTVFIQEEILRHYRLPIYKRLAASSKYDWRFVAGQPRDGDDPTPIPDGILPEIKLKARYVYVPFLKRHVYWQQGLLKLLSKERVDVVIADACPWNLTTWLLPVVCRPRKISLIKWSHIIEREEKGIRKFLKKIELRKFHAFLSYGKKVKEILADWGFEREKAFIVYNSLDYDEQVRIREKMDGETIRRFKEEICGEKDSRLVVFVGRLTKEKKIVQIIEAIRRLRERGRRVCSVLIGNGSYSPRLKEMIRQVDLEGQIRVLNDLWEEKDVGRYLMAADLSVVPCGAGLVVMHSFVYGTPVLTHNQAHTLHPPEAEVILPGRTGIFYEEDDVGDLVQKMEDFLYPVSGKAAMSKACKEIIEKYYNPHYQERVIHEAVDYVLSQREGH